MTLFFPEIVWTSPLNTCTCMVLFLPVFDYVEWLCTVHVYRGMKGVLCFLKRRIKEAQFLRNVPSNSYLQAASKGKSVVLVT